MDAVLDDGPGFGIQEGRPILQLAGTREGNWWRRRESNPDGSMIRRRYRGGIAQKCAICRGTQAADARYLARQAAIPPVARTKGTMKVRALKNIPLSRQPSANSPEETRSIPREKREHQSPGARFGQKKVDFCGITSPAPATTSSCSMCVGLSGNPARPTTCLRSLIGYWHFEGTSSSLAATLVGEPHERRRNTYGSPRGRRVGARKCADQPPARNATGGSRGPPLHGASQSSSCIPIRRYRGTGLRGSR